MNRLSNSLPSSTGFPAGNCTGQRTFDNDSLYSGDLQVFGEYDLIHGNTANARVCMPKRNVTTAARTVGRFR